jgi:hypothetical protein
MDIVRHQVVLDEAPVFRLVLGNDTEVGILKPSSLVDRFASPHVSGALLLDDIHGNLQPRGAVDTALTSMVMLVIGVQGKDLVAEESRRFHAGVGDQRLVYGEFEFEMISQEFSEL